MASAVDTSSASTPAAGAIGLNLEQASVAIGFEPGSRWLLEEGCPVPRCDIRRPGATKPVWRWLWRDLEAFLAQRRVLPGQGSPWGQG
jgi:hypothetical protein